jgi:hypothetical protein
MFFIFFHLFLPFLIVYSLLWLKNLFVAIFYFLFKYASLYLFLHCCSSHFVGCPSINFLLFPAMSICYSQHELMLKGTVHRVELAKSGINLNGFIKGRRAEISTRRPSSENHSKIPRNHLHYSCWTWT